MGDSSSSVAIAAFVFLMILIGGVYYKYFYSPMIAALKAELLAKKKLAQTKAALEAVAEANKLSFTSYVLTSLRGKSDIVTPEWTMKRTQLDILDINNRQVVDLVYSDVFLLAYIPEVDDESIAANYKDSALDRKDAAAHLLIMGSVIISNNGAIKAKVLPGYLRSDAKLLRQPHSYGPLYLAMLN